MATLATPAPGTELDLTLAGDVQEDPIVFRIRVNRIIEDDGDIAVPGMAVSWVAAWTEGRAGFLTQTLSNMLQHPVTIKMDTDGTARWVPPVGHAAPHAATGRAITFTVNRQRLTGIVTSIDKDNLAISSPSGAVTIGDVLTFQHLQDTDAEPERVKIVGVVTQVRLDGFHADILRRTPVT